MDYITPVSSTDNSVVHRTDHEPETGSLIPVTADHEPGNFKGGHISEAIFTLNTSGVISNANKEGGKLLDVDPDNLAGSDFRKYVSAETLPVFETFLTNSAISHSSENCIVLVKPGPGSLRFVHLEGTATDAGDCRVVARDITHIKRTSDVNGKADSLFRETLQAANIGSFKLDYSSGSWISSDVTDQIFGIDKDYSRTYESWLELVHPDDREMLDQYLRNQMAAKCPKLNKDFRIIRPADSKTRWIAGLGKFNFDSQGNPVSLVGTVQDITARKKAESKMIRADRLNSVISRINHAILHIRNKDELFEEACRIATDYGKFQMAWIGLVDEPSQTLKPIVFSGTEAGYISRLRQISVKDDPEGQGPAARAIREQRYCVINDIENDPMSLPWRREALLRNYRSAIALPLRQSEKVIGAFSLYASVPDFFNPEEISLLRKLVDNISFAIETMDSEKVRKETLEALIESQRNLQKAQEIGKFGSWIYFLSGEVSWSDEMYRIYGLEKDKFIPDTRSCLELLHPDDRKLFTDWMRAHAAEKKPGELEYRTTLPDGRQRYVIGRAELVYSAEGLPHHITCTTLDITERKLAEQNLIQLNQQLKDLNATKDKLFSVIAHDLRSPFNSILGFSELLIYNIQHNEMDQFEDFITRINSSAKQTLILLENLLAWAKSQTGSLIFKPETMPLQPVIDQIINISAVTAQIKNIALNQFIPDNICVIADQNMLKAILRNLISNALKFTHTGGMVNVYAVPVGNSIRITVADNGIGMKENESQELFKSGANKSAFGTLNESGSGLGLILCKEFVDKHGGEIWVESKDGKGSKFHFTLPLS